MTIKKPYRANTAVVDELRQFGERKSAVPTRSIALLDS
jgi:hypothetical protein